MPDLLALLARFNFQTISWQSSRMIEDPHEISLLPRTLTWVPGYNRVLFESTLSQAAIDQLSRTLTALPRLASFLGDAHSLWLILLQAKGAGQARKFNEDFIWLLPPSSAFPASFIHLRSSLICITFRRETGRHS